MAISNTKVKGRTMVLQIGSTADPATASFTTVGGVRAKGHAGSVEPIDISDGDDDEWVKLLEGGARSLTLNVSGLVSNNASYETMRQKFQAGAIWAFQLAGIGDGDAIKGKFLIASLEENGEHNGAQQFTASLSSADTPTFTDA
jgi:predicted secreted protein